MLFKADCDPIDSLKENFVDGFVQSEADFVKEIKKDEKFEPPGKMITQYTRFDGIVYFSAYFLFWLLLLIALKRRAIRPTLVGYVYLGYHYCGKTWWIVCCLKRKLFALKAFIISV